ncbi:MAG: hemolysin family protein, partial [Lachnospiraceae bacterium]
VQLVVTLVNLIMGGFYLGRWLLHIRVFVQMVAQTNLRPMLTLSLDSIQIISLMIATAILLYILLTFGILIPKKIAAKYPEQWAYLFVTPIYYIMKLLSPLTGLVTITTTGILRIFGMKAEEDNTDVTEEEIISMVNEGHEQGVLLASEAEMITNIFEFGDKEAQDIMTPRSNMVAIDGMLSLQETIQFILQERNSRYPVYEGNVDHIIGILHLKDALRIHASGASQDTPIKDIDGLLREVHFIPETRNIDALFKSMQSLKIQMVIVVDEYGQTTGLIAMEDILEEIVGNILDEYDEDEKHVEEKGENTYIVEGMTPLDEVEELLHIEFEENEFDTMNGYLISKLDKIPEEDEEFNIDISGYNFKILSVKNKMIDKILITHSTEPITTLKEEEI